MTHEWSRAVFDIGVAYKEDVNRVMEVLQELGQSLRADPRFESIVLDNPVMLGVDAFGDSAVTVKFTIMTRPQRQWEVKREMLRRIKLRFDELGIEIPFPHRTLYFASGLPDTVAKSAAG
jgi:small conductance mechanosensitive channel